MTSTPSKRSNAVMKKHHGLFNRLLHEAQRLADAPGELDTRARRMVEITEDLAAKVAPATICRRGCSYCCHQSVIVSSWEAERIGRYVGQEPKQFPPMVRGDDLKPTQRKYAGVPCPFLKRGQCSIYPVRPMACATHFSLEEDPELCNIEKHAGKPLAFFNFMPLNLSHAMVFLNAGCSFADLRDYFPGEAAERQEGAAIGTARDLP